MFNRTPDIFYYVGIVQTTDYQPSVPLNAVIKSDSKMY